MAPSERGRTNGKSQARYPGASPCPKGCGGEMIDRGYGRPPSQCDECRRKATHGSSSRAWERKKAKTKEVHGKSLSDIIAGTY